VRFQTKLSDGHYYFVEGGARPFPLPVPDKKLPPPPAAGGAGPQAAPQPPPGPVPFRKIRVGTTFGIEFGRAYGFNKDGKLLQTLRRPVTSFQQVQAPPPGVGRPNPVLPLPPQANPKRD